MKPAPRNEAGAANQESDSAASPVTSRWRLNRVRLAILIMLLAGVAVVWRLRTMDERLDCWLVSSEDGKLGFIVTAYPKIPLPPDPTIRQRFVYGYQNLRLAWQFGTRNPNHQWLGPQPPQEWDISRLLHQSMWVSGRRYLIAKDIHGGIQFGTTNALNGNQWAAAAERALQDNGMVVIHIKAKLVQVVPKTSLQDYIRAHLVESGAASNSMGSGVQR